MTTTLTHHEFETAPFTDSERRALARYEQTIEGIPDCFDVLAQAGFSAEELRQIPQYFVMLTDWHTALDTLYGALLNPAEGPRFSVAGRRLLNEQITQWYRLLNVTRREACKALLGTAGPEPEVDAGRITFGDIPGVLLDGTIAAENQ